MAGAVVTVSAVWSLGIAEQSRTSIPLRIPNVPVAGVIDQGLTTFTPTINRRASWDSGPSCILYVSIQWPQQAITRVAEKNHRTCIAFLGLGVGVITPRPFHENIHYGVTNRNIRAVYDVQLHGACPCLLIGTYRRRLHAVARYQQGSTANSRSAALSHTLTLTSSTSSSEEITHVGTR